MNFLSLCFRSISPLFPLTTRSSPITSQSLLTMILPSMQHALFVLVLYELMNCKNVTGVASWAVKIVSGLRVFLRGRRHVKPVLTKNKFSVLPLHTIQTNYCPPHREVQDFRFCNHCSGTIISVPLLLLHRCIRRPLSSWLCAHQ